jgi:energy-coupling factor transport system permease protein
MEEAMKNIKFGQYVMGNSIIHQLDPRTKIIGGLAMILSTLINNQWPVILINMLLLQLAILAAKIKIATVFSSIRRLWLLFTLTIIFQAIFIKGEVLFQIGGLSFSKEGIWLGVLTAFRLTILLLTSALLTATTSSIHLATGLESVFSPLKYFKIPVQQFAMVISIGLRFIPTIMQEAETIMMAQKSRGAQFYSSNFFLKLKSIMAVMVPLLAISLQRAEDLAIAMESRCYHRGINRSKVNDFYFNFKDFFILAIIFSTLIFACLYR